MPEDAILYEVEGGTDEYLRLVVEMEERWWNRPGTDKSFVDATIRAFDDDYRNAVLVR